MLDRNIDLNGKRILVTGAAGFIGANLCKELLRSYEDVHIYGIDNMNDYYDPKLKEYRLSLINSVAEKSAGNHIFIQGSIADKKLVDSIFQT